MGRLHHHCYGSVEIITNRVQGLALHINLLYTKRSWEKNINTSSLNGIEQDSWDIVNLYYGNIEGCRNQCMEMQR